MNLMCLLCIVGLLFERPAFEVEFALGIGQWFSFVPSAKNTARWQVHTLFGVC